MGRRDEDATRTLRRDDARRSAPVAAIVRVSNARAEPSSYALTIGRCRIGSGKGCDLTIDEPTVSRAHAELELVAEGVVVRDLGSRNGIFYLGQRIESAVLTLGARIQVGVATLAIEPDRAALEADLDFPSDEYRGILGASVAMHRLFALLSRLEGSLVPVLVEGESGVGKELVARAIHEGSLNAGGPLVTLNCGALPRDLVSSELFGHTRGAFTGATGARRGAFQQADGGTLFLDEVGELPLEIQPVLLRALESGEIRPVGGESSELVKVRVIAATNRDLSASVEAGRFREDLFYRLAVVELRIPPLRQRPEDVELLARRFAEQGGVQQLPSEVLEELRSRSWPGNARELRNAVHAYGALGVVPRPQRRPEAMMDVAIEEFLDVRRPYAEQKDDLVDRFSRAYLQSLLAHTRGNQAAAARIAGLDRTYLGRMLAKLGLPKKA